MWVYSGVIVVLVAYLVATQNSVFLFERFATMFQGGIGARAEERDLIYALAWNDFLDFPVFGASYVVADTWLAHNFFLDAFSSTGLVGGVFFLIALFWAIRGMIRLLHGSAGPHGYSIALTGVCFIVVGATSGSVGQFPELWLFLTVMTVLGNEAEVGSMHRLRTGAS
jgi:O-antigen ligase